MATHVHSNDGQRRIRTASEEDIKYIWVIDSSATRKFARIPALADLAISEESPEKFGNWLTRGRVYLIDDLNRPVGFIAAPEADEVLFINEIGIHEEHRGRGLGGRLLEAVFQWAQDIAQKKNRQVACVSLTTYIS